MIAMLLSSLALAGAQAASASPPAPALAAKGAALPADIVRFFEGSWTGSGNFVRGNKPLQSTYRFESVSDGQGLLVRHQEQLPHTFSFVGLWSVDTRSGDVVMMLASNLKGGARMFRSSGWQGATLTFRPDPSLQTWFAQERITIQRLDATRFSARYELSRDGVNWGGGDFQTFTRDPAAGVSPAQS